MVRGAKKTSWQGEAVKKFGIHDTRLVYLYILDDLGLGLGEIDFSRSSVELVDPVSNIIHVHVHSRQGPCIPRP